MYIKLRLQGVSTIRMKPTKPRQHKLEPIQLDAYKPLREVVSESLASHQGRCAPAWGTAHGNSAR